jgi:hypothetical protein
MQFKYAINEVCMRDPLSENAMCTGQKDGFFILIFIHFCYFLLITIHYE